LISSAKIANLVDAFIQDVFHTAEPVAPTARPLAIRHKITEYAKFLGGNGANPEQVFSTLQQMRDRAFREIMQHSPNRVATASAEFFQEVFDLLARRLPTSIDQGQDGFRVIVSIPDALPHIAKAQFGTQEAAEEWRDSDLGDSAIKAILDRAALQYGTIMPGQLGAQKMAIEVIRKRRRALVLIADAPDGVTEQVLLAHDVTTKQIVALIEEGLATARADRVRAGGREIEVTRVRITEAGRRTLTKARDA
jgi:putative heme iron utilization protein